ncbi:MAG: pantoate--beta-alanine ligase [Acidimicrobiales bacterium]
MDVLGTRAELRSSAAALRSAGANIGLVATMGSLHAGHLSLVEAANRNGDSVVVSIFVNPLQFASGTDLEAYPRDLGSDLSTCEAAGAAAVFTPTAEEMYPEGEPGVVVVPASLGKHYEGASRPGHLEGVATVVTKLLNLVGTCRSYFGEKDYQQLMVVRRLVADLDVDAAIVACPTVREPDGLALSSRNALLGAKQRAAATALYRALEAGRGAIEAGEREAWAVESEMSHVLDIESRLVPIYAGVADPARLMPIDEIAGPVRLLVAAEVGPVRLIDNLGVDAAPDLDR